MISSETVDQTLEKMSAMNPAQAQAMSKQMSGEQPYVLVYLLATGEREEFDVDESEIFFYIGSVIWQLMRQNPRGMRKISERDLQKAEKANQTLLKKMASDSEGDFFSAAEEIALNSPEPEALRYITDALMEDDEGNPDNPPFQEEHLGAAFLYLKIVLDALIQGRK